MQSLHKNLPLASVVVSYYKNLQNLETIFLGLNCQTAKNVFEVIVSEDDDVEETRIFLDQQKPNLSFPMIHVSQKDDGFRKCKALNNALKVAQSELIIFLDGDCVPHKKLVEEYLHAKQPGRVMYGRRVMLSKNISEQVLETKRIGALNFFNLLKTQCRRVEEGLYLKIVPQFLKKKKSGRLLGCNMGICKSDLIAINGFDEDYTAPGGGEDTDIEWRLQTLPSIHFYSMKYRAIVYHLYHEERFTSAMELKTHKIVEDKIRQDLFVCKNGLRKLI